MSTDTLHDELEAAFGQLLTDRCTPTVVRRIEAGEPPEELWRDLAGSGFLDALVPEARGGAGLALRDVLPLVQACGFHAVPLPFAETLLVRGVFAHAGRDTPEGPLQLDAIGTLLPAEDRSALQSACNAARIAGAAARVLEMSLAYAQQLIHLVLLFGLVTGLSVEIVVGHQVGAGRLHDAHTLVRKALARGLVVSVAVAGAAALAGPWLLRLFTADAAIIAAAGTLLWWTVLLEPGRTFNLVVINALRAAGDARYPVLVGSLSMLLVLAGGSWLLGVQLELGLPGVWIAYAADEWLRGLLMWRRWQRLAWVPQARAARRRVAAAG